MLIERYVLVDKNDHERGGWFTSLLDAKLLAATLGGHAVIKKTYKLADSELVWIPGGRPDIWLAGK